MSFVAGITPGEKMNTSALKYKSEIDNYIEAHREEYIKELAELCSINSEKAAAKDGAPYGEGAAQCLTKALGMAGAYGFKVKNYKGYVGTADLDSALPPRLDILAHLDVVPAGSGWNVCEPFSPVVKGGRIYGRGTSDDKGPALAALYAMRAVKELGIPLKGNVRLILGCDEECGSSDIEYYYKTEKAAPMTFSPDSEFPVVNIEKGRLHGKLERKFTPGAASADISAEAGIKVNVVPAQAQARITGIGEDGVRAAAAAAAEQTKITFALKDQAGGIIVHAKGRGAHASTPEAGCSALTGLLVFISLLPGASQAKQAAEDLLALFPHRDTLGEALGVKLSDEISGSLTLALSMLRLDKTGLSAEFDCRMPICAAAAGTPALIQKKCKAAGFSFSTEAFTEAHYVPADSLFIKVLLSSYEAITGRPGECIATGGGTYVHEIENGVAFGAVMPGTNTRMHGPDEFAVISELMSAAKIYALAIAQLCG